MQLDSSTDDFLMQRTVLRNTAKLCLHKLTICLIASLLYSELLLSKKNFFLTGMICSGPQLTRQ